MEEEDDYHDQIQPLDFDAPILSVRRIANTPRPARTEPVVPFNWEQTPGRPKPPPAPVHDEPVNNPLREEEEEEESDESTDVPRGSGSFWKDPEMGDLMMGRFLAAAKAAATGPLRAGPRRRGRDGHFSVAHGPISRIFVSNPVSPCIVPHDNLGQDKAEAKHLWDAVYRHNTHKLGRENLVLRENRSKLASESNRLTYWSDAQSPDGSSLYHGESNLDRRSPCDTTLYFDSVQLADTRNSKSSSVDDIGETNNGIDIDDPGADEHGEYGDSSLDSEEDKGKSDTDLSHTLLSPPLPSSPSESWLHRTLPSVSSKNPPPRSLLGIQVQYTSLNDLKWINDLNYSKAVSRKIRSIQRGAK